MKKILLLAIVVMMSAGTAFAQIQVSEETSKFDVICSVRAKYVYINHFTKGDYSMYSLTMPTTNQFDDPFSIRLGDDHLSALETLESMMQLFDIGEKNSVSIRDVSGQEMRVYYTSGFGGGLVNFSRKGFAGHAGLAKSELEKLIQRFKSAKGIE